MTLDSSFIYYRSKLIIVIRRNSSNSFLETKGQTYLFDRLESFILFFFTFDANKYNVQTGINNIYKLLEISVRRESWFRRRHNQLIHEIL